ncbi:MAG TPA: polysaccharide pyruvyl transferase family protein [Woeseiaceae bacterium]|nr:polysaccharide pyruvyl transferase family protein [Woeseiaceae bacterium]
MTETTSLGSRPKILPPTGFASRRPLPGRARWWLPAHKRQKAGTPKKIGLFGLFGTGNSGNDGSLEAMLRFLRESRPDAEITCICSAHRGAADRVARSLGVATTSLGFPPSNTGLLNTLDRLLLTLPRRIASLVHAVRRACKLDALVVPGTGILDDFGGSPFGMPLALLAWCLVARLSGTWIAFVSIGAGPIENPISRWLMRSAVALADYRSYRDAVSKTFMQSIGFDARADAVYPDIAFKLAAPAEPRRQSEDGRLVVGVGVMTYFGWRNDATRGAATHDSYLAKITGFVLWLLDRGHAVRILMGDTNDQRAVDELLANVATARPALPDGRFVFEPISSLHDLMRQIAQTDVVVATRYHNIVCALKLGKPTVSIGYADKNDVLMAEMGLGGFCQHIERLSLDRLIEQFDQLLAERPRYERAISAANLACQQRLEHQDRLLAARLP